MGQKNCHCNRIVTLTGVKTVTDWACKTMSFFPQTKQSPVLKYLSPIVRDFSPSLLKPFVDISPESVSTEVTAWLDGVHEVVTSLTAAVLAHVASVEAVATIRYTSH